MCVCVGKQFSLDSRMDLVFHGINASDGDTLQADRKHCSEENRPIEEDAAEDVLSGGEGTKGRYSFARSYLCFSYTYT